jgi:uncharacterized membrane protein YbaN (DUF454 family)
MAYLFLGFAVAGVVIPGLPTTPFVLLAAWAAAKGSRRLHGWLLEHRLFGPVIRDWQAHGAVSVRAKWASTLTMIVFAGILAGTSPKSWVTWFGVVSMTVIAVWLWRRPEPQAIESDSMPPHESSWAPAARPLAIAESTPSAGWVAMLPSPPHARESRCQDDVQQALRPSRSAGARDHGAAIARQIRNAVRLLEDRLTQPMVDYITQAADGLGSVNEHFEPRVVVSPGRQQTAVSVLVISRASHQHANQGHCGVEYRAAGWTVERVRRGGKGRERWRARVSDAAAVVELQRQSFRCTDRVHGVVL